MVLTESKTISFDDFIDWLPERSEVRHKLRDGEILEMPKHAANIPKLPDTLSLS
jgi:Uma2 family endonuclease